jgi:hypothetical protein
MKCGFLFCSLLITSVIGRAGESQQLTTSVSLDAKVLGLIELAGNAEDDDERLAHLNQLAAMDNLPPPLHAEALLLKETADQWVHAQRLNDWPKLVDKDDLDLSPGSSLYPLAQFYHARVLTWETLESGATWKHEGRRRNKLDRARKMFENASRAFPENRVIRMYLGEPVPPEKRPAPVPGAPPWAVYQRESLERLNDIITWWIDNRMQTNGEYGGGWGDDCEMWRWWMPVLVAFDDPDIVAAQERFSRALLDQSHMARGYTSKMSDVEHTAEDSADVLTPMMFIDPDNEEWRTRTLRLTELMSDLWTGYNDRGHLQFKGTYFNVDGVSDEPRKACDTVYHPRTVQPALLYWQRTGDPELTKLFTAWMDTWVEATARAERGKPAGIIPSAIHWPDGGIGGLSENWWDPNNHNDDPLYFWPSAMSMMTNTLLLTSQMTGDAKYEEPIRSMARIRLEHIKNPPKETPEPGSATWCASNMAGITEVVSKHKLLTGSKEFDELIRLDGDPYMRFRLHDDWSTMTAALRDTAEALRINFAGYTSEVRYTDRVLRFPRLFVNKAMYPEPLAGFHEPDTQLLFSTLTGEPGSGLYFPINAVRWLTPPRDIAALVTESGNKQFEAEIIHFGNEPRKMGAELYLLESGRYTFTLNEKNTGKTLASQPLTIEGKRTQVKFQLSPETLCVILIQPDAG